MRRILVLAIAMALFIVGSVGVASADPVPGDLHTGLYSDKFDSSGDLNGVGAAAGQKVTFGGTFHDVTEAKPNYNPSDPNSWSNTVQILEGVWSAKATPFANVDVKASAASIASGSYDAEIKEWVRHVKAWLDKGGNRSLIVAPLQEHNGNWTPYGCNPTAFKQAYAKFIEAFNEARIDETKVRFAWAPNGWTPPGCGSLASYYPGDDLVDIVSISAYNFGTCLPNASNQTPAQAFDPYLGQIRNTIPGARSKPFVIAQTASPRLSCGGNQSVWITSMMTHLKKDPNVVGFVWFNFNKETDFRAWTSSLAQGWKDGVGIAGTKYTWPLTEWFRPGPLSVGATPASTKPCKKGPCDTIVSIDPGGRWGLFPKLGDTWSDLADVSKFYFGNPGDIPFMGDWDNTGTATPGLYRQSDGFVYIRKSNTQGTADIQFYFGNPGDVPLVGDFDGDGKDTVSIWRPSEAKVYVINKLGSANGGLGAADYSFSFGNPGDQPFVGDFDGDGTDTIGLYRRSTGFVYFRNSNKTGNADFSFFYGDPGDSILVGDWDGDGDDTVAVYRPSTGRVYVNLENKSGAANWSGYVGSYPHVVAAPRG